MEIHETVLTGTAEMLAEGRVDLAIGSSGAGVEGAELMTVRFVPVAHPDHPPHQLGRKVTARDLRRHRRILIRDTATQRKSDVKGIELRWAVSHKATSSRAVAMGLGAAWLPEDTIAPELAAGVLKVLPMAGNAARSAVLYLMHGDPEFPGRDAARLAAIIHEQVAERCARERKRRAK